MNRLSVSDSRINPVPDSTVPTNSTGLGPNRSISQPAMGPTGPPSDRDREKIKEVEARLDPNDWLTGSRNTTKPLLKAELLTECMNPASAMVHHPMNTRGRRLPMVERLNESPCCESVCCFWPV